jgi:hypothetical protein
MIAQGKWAKRMSPWDRSQRISLWLIGFYRRLKGSNMIAQGKWAKRMPAWDRSRKNIYCNSSPILKSRKFKGSKVKSPKVERLKVRY